jgi:hypothetical protein
MDREKIKNISVIIAVSSAVICMVSIFFSYRVYVSSKKLVTEYRDDLSALRLSYAELEKQYKPTENNLGQTPLKKSPPTTKSGDEAASDYRKKVQELTEIIRSTGLDQLVANQDLDPSILSRIYEDYAIQDQVRNYREQAVERSRELHEIDRNQYDEELMALYDRARLRRRGVDNPEDQEKAFNEMLAKFPDAYATGMAIAERGLRSAFLRKGDDVKEYYSMLSENDKFSNIVTDRGTEAMPNLENYLAYSYIQEGRFEDALVFIESLEKKYANSFVLTRGSGRRLKLIPASQAAENLRMLIE